MKGCTLASSSSSHMSPRATQARGQHTPENVQRCAQGKRFAGKVAKENDKLN